MVGLHVSMRSMACVVLLVMSIGWTCGCRKEPVADEAAALFMLRQFVADGADLAALTKHLRPTHADYKAVFLPDYADWAEQYYAADWDSGKVIVSPGHPSKTGVLISVACSDDLKSRHDESESGGWNTAARMLAPNLTVLYRFQFVEPGSEVGMRYEGLIYVNGHWRLFIQPWRILTGPAWGIGEPMPNWPPHGDLSEAAAAGDAEAQRCMGYAYHYGIRVLKDDAEAVKWWRLAAEQGHGWAQYRLGQAYLVGEGVQQDETEAKTWFRRAKENKEFFEEALREAQTQPQFTRNLHGKP